MLHLLSGPEVIYCSDSWLMELNVVKAPQNLSNSEYQYVQKQFAGPFSKKDVLVGNARKCEGESHSPFDTSNTMVRWLETFCVKGRIPYIAWL